MGNVTTTSPAAVDAGTTAMPAQGDLAVTSLDPTSKGSARWSNRWKAALNAFDSTLDGRISATRR